MNSSTNSTSSMVVFGAGGKVGRAAVAEAVRRGHRVTAVVRDPSKHPDLASDAPSVVRVVRGDVTDADSVAAVAAGHDAALNATARMDVPSEQHFVAAAQALAKGLRRAGVHRLVVVGIATTLETAPGMRVMDDPAFPAEYRAFSQGHVAEFEALTAVPEEELDWLMVVPPMNLDPAGPRTGRYRTARGTAPAGPSPTEPGHISHPDLAIALVDELTKPTHSRIQLAVAD